MAYVHYYTDEQDKRILLDTPVLLYSGFVTDEQKWYIDAHDHPFCELIYICEGRICYEIGDRKYYAESGDLILYSKGIAHKETALTDSIKTYFCGIGNVYYDGCVKDRFYGVPDIKILKTKSYREKLESYITDLIRESTHKLDGYSLVCSGILSSILTLIYRMIRVNADSTESLERSGSLSNQIIRYLTENYEQDITLSNLSERFYVSKDYMSHIFKNETGISPIKYLILYKIERIKTYLIETDKSIAEIAALVGYEDANYMTQVFKKNVGESPSKFRADHR